MSDTHEFYFSEILDWEDLAYAFDSLEAADKAQMADLALFGLISGGAVTAVSASGTPTATVAAFVGADKNGARVTMASPLVVTLTNDEAGNPTLPSAGKFKWLCLAIHYAKFGSDHVLDGDGLDIYSTTVETISSEMGQLDVDHNAALVGTLRLIQGTEAATIGAAGRPAVSSPDIIICDLAIDHTGFVIGGMAGVSNARTDWMATARRSGFPIDAGNFESGNGFVLLDEISIASEGHVRRYSGVVGGIPTFVETVNAHWDGVTQLWNADVTGDSASMRELTAAGMTLNAMTRGAATWTDARHSTSGWDARFAVSTTVANGDVSIDGGGKITGTGPQTAYMDLGFYAMPGYPTSGGGANVRVGATFPQAMAAAPSSTTLVVEASSNLASFTATATALGASVNGLVAADSTFTQVRAHITSIP